MTELVKKPEALIAEETKINNSYKQRIREIEGPHDQEEGRLERYKDYQVGLVEQKYEHGEITDKTRNSLEDAIYKEVGAKEDSNDKKEDKRLDAIEAEFSKQRAGVWKKFEWTKEKDEQFKLQQKLKVMLHIEVGYSEFKHRFESSNFDSYSPGELRYYLGHESIDPKKAKELYNLMKAEMVTTELNRSYTDKTTGEIYQTKVTHPGEKDASIELDVVKVVAGKAHSKQLIYRPNQENHVVVGCDDGMVVPKGGISGWLGGTETSTGVTLQEDKNTQKLERDIIEAFRKVTYASAYYPSEEEHLNSADAKTINNIVNGTINNVVKGTYKLSK